MKVFNWKIILMLSMIGLLMGIGTVFIIPANSESLFWFIIYPLSAFIIAKKCSSKYFYHGLFLGILNSIWITLVQVIFAKRYFSFRPEEASKMLNSTSSIIISMVSTGIILGVIMGLFAVVLHKSLKKAELNKQRRLEATQKKNN